MNTQTNETHKKPAIEIRNVSKQYRIGQIGTGTLTHDIQSWWGRVTGKGDPNLKIGQEEAAKKGYFYALKDINLTVYEGEVLGILGRNGAGKSTLLKLLAQVTAPTEGSIDIYGSLTSMLEVGTGFHGEMTGRENVYLNGAILGMSQQEINEKMEDIIEFSEVGQFIDTPVKRYSSGMYMKLAFAVAINLNSDIMILDEVLAVGDMQFQQKCLEAIRRTAQSSGKTILYVSHNMNTIQRLCTRCVVLDEGKIIYSGSTESAIDIYLNKKRNIESMIDYTYQVHPGWLHHMGVKLMRAEYVDHDSIIFEKGEQPKLKLSWINLERIQDLCLRVEIRLLNDSSIGSFGIYDFYGGEANAEATVTLELNIDRLAPGEYQTIYTFFKRDAYGNNFNLDCMRGLDFEKTDSSPDFVWDVNSWGYFELSDYRILN